MVTFPSEKPAVADSAPLAFSWTRSFALLRLILALLCLVLALPGPGRWIGLWAAFAGYAALLLLWRRMDGRMPGFRLLVDTTFLLLCAALPLPYASAATALFYLFVLLAAALLHPLRDVVTVAALTIGFFQLVRPAEMVAFPPVLLLAGIAVAVMALQKKALQERLAATARQAVLSRSEVEHAREDERQRMAADFHDGPLQSFVGLQMRLEVVRKLLERDPNLAREEIIQLQELLKTQAAELRTFVRSMRPVEVDGAGLVPSLRKLVEGFSKESGILASFVGGNTRVSPDSQTSLEILQVVREALHNVQKHSKASRVTVGVGREGQALELSIEDDGTGFPFSGAYTLEELELLRLGPVSIRRRLRNLGGEMLLDSQPGKGASLKIRVPL
ncbi:MAG: sensor histidine kinase [Acidobacteriota bacterium]